MEERMIPIADSELGYLLLVLGAFALFALVLIWQSSRGN
jgi:hypothetical protein